MPDRALNYQKQNAMSENIVTLTAKACRAEAEAMNEASLPLLIRQIEGVICYRSAFGHLHCYVPIVNDQYSAELIQAVVAEFQRPEVGFRVVVIQDDNGDRIANLKISW